MVHLFSQSSVNLSRLYILMTNRLVNKNYHDSNWIRLFYKHMNIIFFLIYHRYFRKLCLINIMGFFQILSIYFTLLMIVEFTYWINWDSIEILVFLFLFWKNLLTDDGFHYFNNMETATQWSDIIAVSFYSTGFFLAILKVILVHC